MTPLLYDLIEKYDGGKLTTDDFADRYINLYRHEPEAELPDDWEAKLNRAQSVLNLNIAIKQLEYAQKTGLGSAQ